MNARSEVLPGSDDPLEQIRLQIIQLGLKTKAEGAAILSSKGRPQNWLLDLRRVFMHRDTLEQIAAEFWRRFEHEKPFQLAGMETAAIPLLTALMLSAPRNRGRVNAFIIRKERKLSGLCNSVEGQITDEPIILLDDIINSSSSAEKARSVIRQAGSDVRRMFAIIDYQSNRGMRWRADNDIEVTAMFTLADFDLNLAQNPRVATQRYRELWHTEIPGGFPFNVVPKSPPVLVESVIYRGCDAGKMHAFDANTGSILWEFAAKATGRKGIMSAPLVHEGRVYFGAFNGTIYCLDAASGKEIWSQAYGEWVGSSPVVAPKHGLVYFGIEYARPWARGSVGAFSLDTGARVWEHLVRKLQHGSPAYWKTGDMIIWGTADHEMVALQAATGEVVWAFPTRRSVKYAPAIDETRGIAAFASFDTFIYVLDLRTGRQLGQWETGEICYTTPLIHNGRLFCGSGDRHFYVIDLDSMELIKKIELGARVYASPKLISGRVVFGTCGGLIVEMDPESLEIKGRLQLPDAVTNAVASTDDGRRIFVSTYMNHLYAFERRDFAIPEQGARFSQNFKRARANVDVDALRNEILSQPEMWKVMTARQETIAVQRETESIFLRSATRNDTVPTEHNHDSAPSLYAKNYPLTMQWVQNFAREENAELGRILIAKLRPKGQVYRHHDHGDYYKVRDRYHLIISSFAGSLMTCGDEDALMREGEVWWFDNKKPHEAFNRSEHDRVHVIFDLLPQGRRSAPAEPGIG